jgi:hypothetical protein
MEMKLGDLLHNQQNYFRRFLAYSHLDYYRTIHSIKTALKVKLRLKDIGQKRY